MAGLTVLNPIHILALASPSSTPCFVTSFEPESSLLWDCELLQPLTFGFRVSSTSPPLDSPDTDKFALSGSSTCNVQQQLLDILSFAGDPCSAQPLACLDPSQVNAHTDNLLNTATSFQSPTDPPPPYAMHSPLASANKTPFSSYRLRRSSKSTMSFKFAAPVPRIPLASVLQNWAAHESPSQHSPACGGDGSGRADLDVEMHDECERGYEVRQHGLGLLLGYGGGQASHHRAHAQNHPQSQPHTHTHTSHSSHSRSKYSRRLRRLAPAPLQLSSTPRHVFRALNQDPSSVDSQRIPLSASAPFVDIPLHSGHGSTPSDLDRIPSLDLSASPFEHSEHSTAPPTSASMISFASAMASMPTAPTSLLFHTATEHAPTPMDDNDDRTHGALDTRMGPGAGMNPSTPPSTHTNSDPTNASVDPHHHSPVPGGSVDLLLWRRTVSRALDSPLSPLRTPKSPRALPVRAVAAAMFASPPFSPLQSASAEIGMLSGPGGPLAPLASPLRGQGSPSTATSPSLSTFGMLAPPPLRRTEWIALPELPDAGPVYDAGSPSDVSRLPLCADLRVDLGVEDLQARAEKCAESIGRASLSLRSCSLLKDPQAIADLCDGLGATFRMVQDALHSTPGEFMIDGSEAKQNWYAKHWELIDSLNKNLSMFYLLSRQVEERPPRIHKLAGLVDKLTIYQAKFADLARRICLSYEKLRLLTLRSEITSAASKTAARSGMHADRQRRREERAAQQDGRVRRRELREEIRRVRGSIRNMRDRQIEAHRGLQDENMFVCNDNDDNPGDATVWKTG